MVGEQYIPGRALSNAKLGLAIHNAVANMMFVKTLLTPVHLKPPKKERKCRIQSNSLQNAARCAESNLILIVGQAKCYRIRNESLAKKEIF